MDTYAEVIERNENVGDTMSLEGFFAPFINNDNASEVEAARMYEYVRAQYEQYESEATPLYLCDLYQKK